jgi:hypothetical protein
MADILLDLLITAILHILEKLFGWVWRSSIALAKAIRGCDDDPRHLERIAKGVPPKTTEFVYSNSSKRRR